jgi:hypothetical protein
MEENLKQRLKRSYKNAKGSFIFGPGAMVKLLFSKATCCHYKTEWCLNLLVITLQQNGMKSTDLCP